MFMHGSFIAFLYAGLDIKMRMEIIAIFEQGNVFSDQKILYLNGNKEDEPYLSGALIINSEYIDLLTLGKVKKPNFSSKFPATLVDTKLNWSDLILDNSTKNSVDHILTWIKSNDIIFKVFII